MASFYRFAGSVLLTAAFVSGCYGSGATTFKGGGGTTTGAGGTSIGAGGETTTGAGGNTTS
ncbi:MAG: hypothetical protein WBV96_10235, partial [Polyangia bacterium]